MGFQQKKKDYLQRLIEEFFARFYDLLNSRRDYTETEKADLLREAFKYFADNFEICPADSISDLTDKIDEYALVEQYARLLKMEYEILAADGDREQLKKALRLVQFAIKGDSTYCWERNLLEQELIRMLET
jgi:hypothetical protein